MGSYCDRRHCRRRSAAGLTGSHRVRVESAQLHCGVVVTSASVLREPVAAAVCDSVRVLGELPPPRRDSNLRSCPVPPAVSPAGFEPALVSGAPGGVPGGIRTCARVRCPRRGSTRMGPGATWGNVKWSSAPQAVKVVSWPGYGYSGQHWGPHRSHLEMPYARWECPPSKRGAQGSTDEKRPGAAMRDVRGPTGLVVRVAG
jgi:hypothetical protein